MDNLGLDLAGGQTLLKLELYGDWYKDPWGWPELTSVDTDELDVERDGLLRGGELGAHPYFHPIEVPKSRLGVRPAVVQDGLTRFLYLSAAAAEVDRLHADLHPWVFGWRQRKSKFAQGTAEWSAYLESLPDHEESGFGLQTDITSCFASISPQRVHGVFSQRLPTGVPATVMLEVVNAHDRLTTRRGLPQRSFASSIIAHAVLAPIDDELAAAEQRTGIRRVRRWMDDISAEGEEDALYRLLLTLQERMRQVGLELNASKTHLRPLSEAAESLWLDDLREIQIPWREVITDDYSGESDVEPDFDVLERLERQILDDPRNQSRVLVSAVLRSLAKYASFENVSEWLGAAHQFPASAEQLSSYLRAALSFDAIDRNVAALWWSEFASSSWGALRWVPSQLAMAFTGPSTPGPIVDVLRSWLRHSIDLQEVALASHHLAKLDPQACRTSVAARLDHASDPLLLRVLALGLLQAGGAQPDAQRAVARDPRNLLLMRYLTASDWVVRAS